MKLNKAYINRDMYSVRALAYDCGGDMWEHLDGDDRIIWQVMPLNAVLKSQANNTEDHILVFFDLDKKCLIDVSTDDCFIDFDIWLFAKKMTKAINLAFKRGTIRIV